jgi:dihydrodipicolinate synthase/N-acetylneuraminate lyase
VRIAGHDAGDPRAPYLPLSAERAGQLAEGLRAAGELIPAA